MARRWRLSLLLLAGSVGICTTDKLYWTDSRLHMIKRANLDGSDAEDIITDSVNTPRGIAIDHPSGKVYWSDFGSNSIKRANIEGSGVETVISTGTGPEAITLGGSPTRIYWTELSGRVMQGDMDGGNVQELVAGEFNIVPGLSVHTEDNMLYYADAMNTEIRRMSLAGGVDTGELLVNEDADIYEPRGLAVNGKDGKMYWCSNIVDKIMRSNLDGTDVETLVTGRTSPMGLAVDHARGKLYWTDRGNSPADGINDRVESSNLDGSGFEILVSTDMLEPHGIAVLEEDSRRLLAQGAEGEEAPAAAKAVAPAEDDSRRLLAQGAEGEAAEEAPVAAETIAPAEAAIGHGAAAAPAGDGAGNSWRDLVSALGGIWRR